MRVREREHQNEITCILVMSRWNKESVSPLMSSKWYKFPDRRLRIEIKKKNTRRKHKTLIRVKDILFDSFGFLVIFFFSFYIFCRSVSLFTGSILLDVFMFLFFDYGMVCVYVCVCQCAFPFHSYEHWLNTYYYLFLSHFILSLWSHFGILYMYIYIYIEQALLEVDTNVDNYI